MPRTLLLPQIPLIRFSSLGAVRHGISTRIGGASLVPYHSLNLGLSTGDSRENVVLNRRLFAQSLGVALADLVIGRLSHGTAVSVFRRDSPDSFPVNAASDVLHQERMFSSDGVVSDVPGLFFFLTFADCVPLLFYDAQQRVVGAAHAGWRGTAAGMGPAVIRAMHEVFGSRPENISAAIGPSIGPCCYQVGAEVPDAFREGSYVPVMAANSRLDLWESNRRQLMDWGIRQESIEVAATCTSCHVDRFFSHRRERGITGRFAACIGLDPA